MDIYEYKTNRISDKKKVIHTQHSSWWNGYWH